MDFSRFTTISFDCYGTLIDWESGILPALRAVLASHGQSLPDAAILELYGEFEAEAESGPYQSYRDVLQSVVRAFADRLHFEASSAEIRSLHESVRAWPPFPDTVARAARASKALQARGDFKHRRRSICGDAEASGSGIRWRDHGGTGEKLQTFHSITFRWPYARWRFLRIGCCTPARASITTSCRRGRWAFDGVGEPEVGSSRDWRGSSLGGTRCR